MLRGHVDKVSAESVAGWAVDDERLQDLVPVSIFVDGRKVGQVTCDRHRPDLRQTGKFGDGRHGFSVEFAEPLSLAAERTVSVRFTANGAMLGNGQNILSATGTRHVPAFVEDRVEQLMRLPGPKSPRDVFETFALYDGRRELYDLLTMVEFGNLKPRDIHYCAFGRFPDAVPPASEDSARDLMNAALLSDEFQSHVIPILLGAYPEKKRLLFVHIPKCAGSDLSINLLTKFPSIDERLTDLSWTSKRGFFECLHDVVLRLRFSDAIYVRGHINLSYYADLQLIRPGDEIFTIIRDPLEIPISQINYILTRFRGDAYRRQLGPDTTQWLKLLNLPSLPEDLSDEAVLELARQMLYNPSIVPTNPLCHWLGGGSAEAVLDRLALHAVEITDTARYPTWLRERWGIESRTRENASQRILTADALGADDVQYINRRATEDIKLHQTVSECLSRSGASSAKGDELA